jgi:hypothetical protein
MRDTPQKITRIKEIRLRMNGLLELYSLISFLILIFNALSLSMKGAGFDSHNVVPRPNEIPQIDFINPLNNITYGCSFQVLQCSSCLNCSEICVYDYSNTFSTHKPGSMDWDSVCFPKYSYLYFYIYPFLAFAFDLLILGSISILVKEGQQFKLYVIFICLLLTPFFMFNGLLFWVILPFSVYKLLNDDFKFVGKLFVFKCGLNYQIALSTTLFYYIKNIYTSIKSLFSPDYMELAMIESRTSSLKLFAVDIPTLIYSILFMSVFQNSVILIVLHSFMLTYRLLRLITDHLQRDSILRNVELEISRS